MKKCFAVVLSMLLPAAVMAAAQSPVRGVVVDDDNNPIAYATVAVDCSERPVTGCISDEKGVFELNLDNGEYSLTVSFVGYKTYTDTLSVGGAVDMGTIVLPRSEQSVGEVVVMASTVTREADRFVVNVAASDFSDGKNGEELLNESPGVVVTDDDISINGRGGVKVYINEQEVRMTGEQLVRYIRTLKASNVQKIEIIPISGAEYDADSASGVIKITLRRQREAGIMGSLGASYYIASNYQQACPSFSIDGHAGKWTVGGYVNHNQTVKGRYESYNRIDYLTSSSSMESSTTANVNNEYYFNSSIHATCDISPRHSLSAEAFYYRQNYDTYSDYTDRFDAPVMNSASTARYDQLNKNYQTGVLANYLFKIDSLGSQLKVLAEYNRKSGDNSQNSRLHRLYMPADATLDSLYRYNAGVAYDVAAASAEWKKVFPKYWRLTLGAKYTLNAVVNDALYESCNAIQGWQPIDGSLVDIDYRENIAAAYGILSFNAKHWGVVAGLRAEYTHSSGKGYVTRDYLSLFPNINVIYKITDDGAYSLSGSYTRNITRPSFMALNPTRYQMSEYNYSCGNPYLNPSYIDQLGLNLTLKYKYSFYFGYSIVRDAIQQVYLTDDVDANMIGIRFENLKSMHQLYAGFYLPIDITRWLSLMVSSTYARHGYRISNDFDEMTHGMLFSSARLAAKMPWDMTFEANYHFQSKAYTGNIMIRPLHMLSASLKQDFLKGRLTARATVRWYIPSDNRFEGEASDYRSITITKMTTPMFSLGLTWNFRSGKEFRSQSVEKASDSSSRF